MRFIFRLILALASAVIGFLLLVFVTLHWFFQQQSAIDLLVEQLQDYIPELSITDARGNFEQGLRIESLQWRDDETQLALDGVEFSLDLNCLMRFQICLKTTSISRLAVSNLDTSKKTGAIQLPSINMPVSLKLFALDIQEFVYIDPNSRFALTDFSGQLSWYLHTLSYTNVEFEYDDSIIGLQGKIKFRKAYPLTLKGSIAKLEAGVVQFDIGGDLDALAVKVDIDGPVTAAFSASLSPLLSPLPWQLDAVLPEYAISDTGYGKTRFRQTKLSLQGRDLTMTGQLNTDINLPHWPGKNRFSSIFSLTGTRLKLKSAQLAIPGGKLRADGIIELGDHFQGNYVAAMRLKAEGINPQLVKPELSGQLASDMQIDAVLKQQEESITLQSINTEILSISGQLLDWPLLANASLGWNVDSGLSIKQATLVHGANQIELRSPWIQEEALALSLALNDIGAFSSLLTGKLSGRINGDVDLQLRSDFSPIRAEGELSFTQFGFDELLIPSATISLRSSTNNPYSALFSAQDLSYKSNDIGDVKGELKVSDKFLTADIAAKTTHYGDARIRCRILNESDTSSESFTTRCSKLDWQPPVDWPIKQIQNTTPIALSWSAPKQLISVEPFCLKERNNESLPGMMICTEQVTRLKPDRSDVNVVLKGVSWQALKPWLHLDWQADGSIDGTAHVSIAETGLDKFDATLHSDNSVLHWVKTATPMTIPLTTMEVSLNGTQQAVLIAGNITTKDHGVLIADLEIDDQRELSGNIELDQLKLETLQAFVTDATEIDGLASADLTISGRVQQPLLQGRLKLEQGVFAHPALPGRMEQAALDIILDHDRASYSGQLSVDSVATTIDGKVDWQSEAFNAKLNLTSNEFRFSPNPQTELWLTPSLQVDWRNNTLSVTGEVTVPKAFINIKSLPKNSVGVSSDAVVINAERQAQTGLDFPIYAEVKVNVGDAVLFRGFGLETLLSGNMLLKYSPQQLLFGSGLIKLNEGHYRAYGQNLRIRNGNLIFTGPIDDPTIQIDAVRNDLADNITVGLRAEGAAKNPTITLFSQPAMSDQAKLHYLISGQAPGSSTGSSSLLISQAAISLGAATSETLLQEYADMIGLRNLQISTNKRENATGNGTEVQIGAYLNPDLYIRYGKGVFDNINSLTMRHRLGSNLLLEAVSSTANSLDLLWSFKVGEKITASK